MVEISLGTHSGAVHGFRKKSLGFPLLLLLLLDRLETSLGPFLTKFPFKSSSLLRPFLVSGLMGWYEFLRPLAFFFWTAWTIDSLPVSLMMVELVLVLK